MLTQREQLGGCLKNKLAQSMALGRTRAFEVAPVATASRSPVDFKPVFHDPRVLRFLQFFLHVLSRDRQQQPLPTTGHSRGGKATATSAGGLSLRRAHTS